MKFFLYTALVLLISTSCGNNEEKTIPAGTDSLPDSSVDSGQVNYISYQKEGVLLDGIRTTFDSGLHPSGELTITNISPVEILERSEKMFNLPGNTDICTKACFVKIRYKAREYTLFGKDVYEVSNEWPFTTTDSTGQRNRVLLSVTHFEMGAADENGLTGCDDYSVLVIKEKDMYQFIGNAPGRSNNNAKKLGYFVLFHDEGCGESIYKITAHEKTIIVGIRAQCQEGGYSANLRITDFTADPEANWYYDAAWTDEVQYTAEEMNTAWKHLK